MYFVLFENELKMTNIYVEKIMGPTTDLHKYDTCCLLDIPSNL